MLPDLPAVVPLRTAGSLIYKGPPLLGVGLMGVSTCSATIFTNCLTLIEADTLYIGHH